MDDRRALSARQAEGRVSSPSSPVFSLVGIALGVATLIIVMAVMNGFRHELLSRILGLSGHVVVQGYGGELIAFRRCRRKVRAVPGVMRVAPDGRWPGDGDLERRLDAARLCAACAATILKMTTVSNTLSPGALCAFSGRR